MADLDFDQIPAQEQMVDNWGQPTPWMQSLWQRLTGQIAAQIASLADALGLAQQGVDAAAAAAAAALSAANAASAAATTAQQGVNDAAAALTYATNRTNLLFIDLNTERNRINGILLDMPNTGVASATPALGYINITHGQPFTPSLGGCTAIQAGILPVVVSATGINSSVLTVYVQDFAGVAYTAGAVSIAWQVSGY